jgi:hypothetical protein
LAERAVRRVIMGFSSVTGRDGGHGI